MFRCSHDSIIKKNINKIMKITAFKAILARRINIRGCELVAPPHFALHYNLENILNIKYIKYFPS